MAGGGLSAREGGGGRLLIRLPAGFGAGGENARYVENRRRARVVGLLTGSYHYLYPELATEKQALAFYQALTSGQGVRR